MMWSPEKIEQLTELWNEGTKPASEIAEIMGITKNAVIGRANRLKLTHRKHAHGNKRPPAPPPVAIAKPHVFESLEQTVALADLEPHHCRWPIGDPLDEDFGFCGKPNDGSSYCAHHHAIACDYTPETIKAAA